MLYGLLILFFEERTYRHGGMSKSLTLVKLKEIFRLNSLNRDFQTSLYLFEDVFRKKLSNEAIFL